MAAAGFFVVVFVEDAGGVKCSIMKKKGARQDGRGKEVKKNLFPPGSNTKLLVLFFVFC